MRELTGPGAVALAEAQAARATPLLVLDVREPWEVAARRDRAAGARRRASMPMGEVPARLGELDAAQPVLCICHHGARSAQVVAFLERTGFASAYNLAGGIDAWSRDVDPGVARY